MVLLSLGAQGYYKTPRIPAADADANANTARVQTGTNAETTIAVIS